MWSNRLSAWRSMACNRTDGILDIFTPLRNILPYRFSALGQEEGDDEILELDNSDDSSFLRAAILELLTFLERLVFFEDFLALPIAKWRHRDTH